jgi:hypothetical protein
LDFYSASSLNIAPCIGNCVSGVMVNVFASSVIDHVFEPRLGLTKDYKIDISCFSAKHTALRSKNKDWMLRIRITCLSEATCLYADCSFSELAL